MAKDGSVAPRERINIVYKSDLGNAKEEVELPFRFLVLGDFTGRDDDTAVEERKVIDINKDNFNDVLEAHEVGVAASVPNKLTDEEGDEMTVDLKFKNMRDFEPDAITEQVPELKKMVDLRDALASLKGPLGNIPKFRKRLQAIMDDPEAQKRLIEELKLNDSE